MIDFKVPPLHPTDDELDNFIDKKLNKKEYQRIQEHLIHCNDCMDIYTMFVKQQDKEDSSLKPVNNTTSISHQEKPKMSAFEAQNTQSNSSTVETRAVNNSWFRNDKIRAIVLSGLVASFALFFILKNNNSNKYTLGTFSITEQMLNNPMSATTETMRTDVIDGDEAIEEIEKSLDLNSLTSYTKAQEAEKNKNFELAIKLYSRKVFPEILKKFDGKKKLQGEILVYNKIAKIYFETNKLKESREFQRSVKDWIQDYYKKYK